MTKFALCLSALFAAMTLPGAPLRVAVWDWANAAPHASALDAAAPLKSAGPDIILLQHVADWKACQGLADALRPDAYRVITCSSWYNPHAQSSGQEVAILAKTKAYISWSEPWSNSAESPVVPGGFAFATFQVGGTNIAVYSVQPGSSSPTAELKQITAKLAAVDKWKVNKPKACLLVGETFPASLLPTLTEFGFEPARVPPALYLRNAAMDAPPASTHVEGFVHSLVTCEINLAPPAPPLAISTPKVSPPPPPSVAPLSPSFSTIRPAPAPRFNWPLMAGGVAGMLVLLIGWRLLLHRPAPPPMRAATTATIANLHTGQITISPQSDHTTYLRGDVIPSGQTQSRAWNTSVPSSSPSIPLPDEVRAGVVTNLSQWLKQNLMRRLIAERTHLLANQESAQRRVRAVDERLDKIEEQIRQRNREYEERIDVLLKALVTAEEQNRELIRAQIALLKNEMAKSRQRELEKRSPEF
jgi:hypothetical protein